MSLTLKIEHNLATIEFDQPDSKVNLLTSEVMKELDSILEKLQTKSDLKALLITSAKKDVFIAGADIKEIEGVWQIKDGEEKSQNGQNILNKLEDLKIPTIAMIDGVALGGGCELALACRYRLATFNEKMKIGLPEVNLGIIPGFAGTYRLPRLIGLTQALKIILTGKVISGTEALKIGLIDRLIPQAGWRDSLGKFIEEITIKSLSFPNVPLKRDPAKAVTLVGNLDEAMTSTLFDKFRSIARRAFNIIFQWVRIRFNGTKFIKRNTRPPTEITASAGSRQGGTFGGDNFRKSRKPKKDLATTFLEQTKIGQTILFKQSRQNVLKITKGFYPAPVKALEVIQKTYGLPRHQALRIEATAFAELAITPICKNLIRVFYVSENHRKFLPPGTESIQVKPIQKCGVIGAGVMGGGIAQLLSSKGIWTRMKDINYETIAKGFQAAQKIYQDAVKKKKLKPFEAENKMARITATLDHQGFKNCDVVMEAVVENMEVKKKVFKELSDVVSSETILCTNTSALSVTEMAKQTQDPSKVVGFHFFNPVHRMPLVEIIKTTFTSPEALAASFALARRLEKMPVLVKDSCGFLVNRILLGYINEAGRILEEGVPIEVIDKMMLNFGMPMGPFTLSDEVGLDVGVKVLHILENSFGERFKPTEIFEKIYARGFLGKKSQKGFYVYNGKEKIPNPEIVKMLRSYSKTSRSLSFPNVPLKRDPAKAVTLVGNLDEAMTSTLFDKFRSIARRAFNIIFQWVRIRFNGTKFIKRNTRPPTEITASAGSRQGGTFGGDNRKNQDKTLDTEEYLHRMLYLMINEAARCLDDHVVDTPETVDLAMIMGTGFPAFRGGLLHYAKSVGTDKIIHELIRFQEKFHSDRFKPNIYLWDLK